MTPRVYVSYGTASSSGDPSLEDVLNGTPDEEDSLRDAPGSLELDVLRNAEVHLLKRNLNLDGGEEAVDAKSEGEDRENVTQKVVKALEITEDLDIWVEWLSRSRIKLGP